MTHRAVVWPLLAAALLCLIGVLAFRIAAPTPLAATPVSVSRAEASGSRALFGTPQEWLAEDGLRSLGTGGQRQTVGLITWGDGENARLLRHVAAPLDLRGALVRLTLKVPDTTHLRRLRLGVSSDGFRTSSLLLDFGVFPANPPGMIEANSDP